MVPSRRATRSLSDVVIYCCEMHSDVLVLSAIVAQANYEREVLRY